MGLVLFSYLCVTPALCHRSTRHLPRRRRGGNPWHHWLRSTTHSRPLSTNESKENKKKVAFILHKEAAAIYTIASPFTIRYIRHGIGGNIAFLLWRTNQTASVISLWGPIKSPKGEHFPSRYVIIRENQLWVANVNKARLQITLYRMLDIVITMKNQDTLCYISGFHLCDHWPGFSFG